MNFIDELGNEKFDSRIIRIGNMSAINLAKNSIAHREEVSLLERESKQINAKTRAL